MYIYAFSRRFYPKRLTVHSGYTFVLSVCITLHNIYYVMIYYLKIILLFEIYLICLLVLKLYVTVKIRKIFEKL